jgi:hypothetical protein
VGEAGCREDEQPPKGKVVMALPQHIVLGFGRLQSSHEHDLKPNAISLDVVSVSLPGRQAAVRRGSRESAAIVSGEG